MKKAKIRLMGLSNSDRRRFVVINSFRCQCVSERKQGVSMPIFHGVSNRSIDSLSILLAAHAMTTFVVQRSTTAPRTTYPRCVYITEPIDVVFEKIDRWEVVLHDLSTRNFTNSPLRAHYVPDGTWIDTPLSVSDINSGKNNREALRDFLKSLVVNLKTGS